MPIILICFLIIILISSFIYFITIDDGTYKEEDWSNTGYVVSENALAKANIENIETSQDGHILNIELDETVDSIIEKLKEENGVLDKYISNKNVRQYLKAFIKAELITQYPDLRNANKIGTQTNENEFQGCIQIHRASSDEKDGKTKLLTYVDYDTFNSYILNDDEQATKHFTLDSNNNLIVAGWTRVTTNIKSNVPDVQNVDNKIEYTLTTNSINYQELVKSYSMPFDFLWALTVMGEDEDFSYNVAKLALNSKIIITVQDNLTTVETDILEEYDIQEKIEKDSLITVTVDNIDYSKQIKKEDENNPVHYYKQTITKNENCRINIDVTYANTWIVDYENSYTNIIPKENVKKDTFQEENTGYKLIEKSILESDSDIASELYNYKVEKCGGPAEYSSKLKLGQVYGNMGTINYKKYSRTINRKNTNTVTTSYNNYTQGTPTVTEKTDKDSIEENFVTLFIKFHKANKNILSAPPWLFEMLEGSPKTSDMVDIVKYLLYKAEDKSYGVETFDFSEYNPSKMKDISNGNINMSGGTAQEKVWNALVSAGFSEYATAGVMGNINGESGFNPEVTEIGSGIGYGLCQWSYGRRDNLEAYANSKGASPSDVNIQIEFLLGDLGVQEYVTEYNETDYLNNSSYKGFGKEEWKNATSPENAAKAYCWWYERPAAYDSRRETWAKEYYNQFHGKAVSVGNGDVVKAAKDLVDSGKIYYDMPRTYAGHYVSNFECVDFTMEVYYNSLGIDIYGIATSQSNWEIRNVKGMYNYLGRNQKIVYKSTAGKDCRNNDNINIDSIAKPGDIIGFDYPNNGYEWDHVVIYIGNGQYAHNGDGPASYGTLDDYKLHSIKYVGRIINY